MQKKIDLRSTGIEGYFNWDHLGASKVHVKGKGCCSLVLAIAAHFGSEVQ